MKKIRNLIILLVMCLLILGLLKTPLHAQNKPIKLNLTKKTLIVGKTCKLKVIGTTKKAKWSSSKKSIATVSKRGKVTAKKPGKCVIKAKVNGKVLRCYITVKRKPKLTLMQDQITLNVGETKVCKLKAINVNSVKANWSSCVSFKWGAWNNNNIVAFKIKGVSAGSGKVTIWSSKNSSVKTTLKVTVIQPVTSIVLSTYDTDLGVGSVTDITADVSPYNASDKSLTWSSSNTSVARVDGSGRVTGVGSGTATITATARNGKKGTISIRVHDVKISIPSLPKEINCYNYRDVLQSSCNITSITFEKNYYKYDNHFSVKIYFQGKKTYDSTPNVSSSCKVGYKLYDSEGYVVESGTYHSDSVVPGELFKGYTYLSNDLKEGSYRIELLNVK